MLFLPIKTWSKLHLSALTSLRFILVGEMVACNIQAPHQNCLRSRFFFSSAAAIAGGRSWLGVAIIKSKPRVWE